MKYVSYFIFLSLFALANVQCSDVHDEFLELDDSLSRAVTPVENSETNPTLLTNWENCKEVSLNELGSDGSCKKATLPWQNGSTTSLDAIFCKDIKASDGWSMLFHTFCKPNTDEDLAYMCFYNKFTGYLKVFYYSDEVDAGESTVWRISSAVNQVPQPFFADLEYFSQPINGDNAHTIWSATVENMVSEDRSGLSKGWNGFEFRVGEYHPSISTNELRFVALNTAYIDIKIDGVTESETRGTITTTNASAGGAVVNAVADVSGKTAKNLVDSFAKNNLDKTFLGFNIKDIVTSVAMNDYVSAFKSGLGFIFKGLFKSEPTVSEVKLQTSGKLTLQGDGTIKTVSHVEPLTFDLEKILSSKTKLIADTIISGFPGLEPVEPINPLYFATTDQTIRRSPKTELGVWNLKNKPTVYYNRYGRFENGFEFTEEEIMSNMLDFNGWTYYPKTIVTGVEVVFNPAIEKYVKSYSVNVELIDVVGGNRDSNDKGKHIIEYNAMNRIKNDNINNIQVYGVSDSLDLGLSGSIYDYPSDLINENTEFYIDWGEDVSGTRAAVVTLTMDIDYNGKVMSFTESRIYDVDYVPNPSERQNIDNPPYSVLLNNGEYKLSGFDLPTAR